MGFALTPGEAPLHFSRSKNVMHVAPIAVAYGYRYTCELVKSLYILVVWRVRE